MQLRVLDTDTVNEVLPYPALIDRIRAAMKQVSEGLADLPLRSLFALSGRRERLGLMQGYLAPANAVGVKLVSLAPDAQARGQSSHLGLMIVYDSDGLRPLALLSGSALTARRTAAASAVATAALARSNTRVLAILGTGEQAEAHIEALAGIRDFQEVRVWGRRVRAAHSLAQRMATRYPQVRACPAIDETVAGADVICTTTSAADPILSGTLVAAGTHVNLVGSSTPDKAEVDEELVRKSDFFVDYRLSALNQAGELRRALQKGVVTEAHIRGEIGEILLDKVLGRTTNTQITVYKSLGIAAQDIAAALLALENAESAGLGQLVSI